MNCAHASGTLGSWDSVFGAAAGVVAAASGWVWSLTPSWYAGSGPRTRAPDRLPPMPGPRRDSLAFTVVVTVLVCLGAALMLLIIALSGGPGSLLLATVLAALPVGPLVACYLWLDRYEPEPKRLLALGLLWGGFVATAAALLSRASAASWSASPTGRASRSSHRSARRPARVSSCSCCCGGAGPSWTGSSTGSCTPAWSASASRSPRTSSTSRPPTTAPTGWGPGGSQALTGTFVLRCLFSPFAHPLFTTFTGIGVGIAVGARSRGVRFLAPLLGYVCAVVAHATWNSLDRLRRAGLRRRLPAADGARARRDRRAWRSGRVAPSGGCSPPRSATRPAAG